MRGIMTVAMVDRDRFDRWMDELVARAIAQDSVSPEFRDEYVKLANLCRQVAEYDPELASKVFLSAEMLGYTFAVGVAKKIVAKQDRTESLIKPKSMRNLGLNGNHQKIVNMSEVEGWVTQGWDFVTALPGKKAVVRLPTKEA